MNFNTSSSKKKEEGSRCCKKFDNSSVEDVHHRRRQTVLFVIVVVLLELFQEWFKPCYARMYVRTLYDTHDRSVIPIRTTGERAVHQIISPRPNFHFGSSVGSRWI